jgi:hypothetical protein
MRLHAAEQIHGILHIVAQILERIAGGFTHEGVCGEVQHHLGLALPDCLINDAAIAQVAHDQGTIRRQRRRMPLAEVVEDHHAVPRRQQGAGRDTSNVAGTAGDHDFHVRRVPQLD